MISKLTVSQLTNYIAGVFEDESVLHNITVIGEVSEIKRYPSKVYFTLKEEDYVLSCLSFHKLDFLEEGKTIEAVGTVNYYKKNSRVSFLVSSIVLTGEGAELARLKALKEKLEAEGIFSNRPPLPKNVNKIGVITSESGAVIHDIISVVRSKNPLVSIALVDSRVQGIGSAESIIHAINKLNKKSFGCDVIIVARGGGSEADLSAFNDENLARTVSASKIPIVSAIGHQVDYTLCDLASSARAGTPSIAADLVVTPLIDLIENIHYLLDCIKNKVKDKYKEQQEKILFNASKIVSSSSLKINDYRYRIIDYLNNIKLRVENIINDNEHKLFNLTSKLDSISPLKVLSQGYTKVVKNNKEIFSKNELNKDDNIDIIFVDGKTSAKIN